MELCEIVASLIFASDKPLSEQRIQQLTGCDPKEITQAIEKMRYDSSNKGIQLVAVAGGYQFRTNPRTSSWVRRLRASRAERLTRPMLEVLAIIAHDQPLTRPEIEEIRGVDSSGILRTLLERGLIRIVGRKDEVGRPLIYGTTRRFLEFFQLQSLSDLPPLRDIPQFDRDQQNHAPSSANQLSLDEREPELLRDLDPAADAHQASLLANIDQAIEKANQILSRKIAGSEPQSSTEDHDLREQHTKREVALESTRQDSGETGEDRGSLHSPLR